MRPSWPKPVSKYIAHIPLGAVERIAIVFGGGRSMAQVKGDADYIMNAGFYDMTTGKPVGHLKADGTVYAKEGWTSWGYAWGQGGDIRMEQLPSDAASYLSGVPLLTPWDGLDAKLSYPADVGGTRPRTALALAGDTLILYCADSPTTPERLREELHSLGAGTALMLDSGGSSQCDFQGERIDSARRVHNYLAVWLKKRSDTDLSNQKKVCLDPGHGVETAGKRSPDGTYREHEFALDMAKRIKPILERHGVQVAMTRTDEHDVSIAQRYQTANAIQGLDLFVSLHSNAAGSGADWMSARGYGIYTSTGPETAQRNVAARKVIARALEAGLALWGDGIFHDENKGISVLWKTDAPAILIEHLFHDNREDVVLLKDSAFRDKLAQVDAKGILDYLGIAWQDEPGNGSADTAPSDWAAESWQKAVGKGVFDGTDPQGALTRELAAVVLDRLGLL